MWQKVLKAISFGAIDPNKPQPKKERVAQPKKAAPEPAERKERTRSPKIHEVTSTRLYVGNLDYDAVESDLEDLFKGVGNVISAEVVTNSRTQQSKGFAFVEMGSIEEAKRAVEVLHDQEFMSRKLLVSGAKSDGPKNGDGSFEAA